MSICTRDSRTWVARGSAAVVTTVLVGLAAGCGGSSIPGGLVVGSGQVVSETRDVSAFTEVEANGVIALEIAKGATTGVVVVAQSSLVPITRTTVDGARLTVDTTKSYTTSERLTVKVTAPRLTAITLTGAASVTGEAVDPSPLAMDLSGGARADLSGTVDDLVIKASGGSVILLGGLQATTATVDLSGGVVATLSVSSSLTGTASGGVVITLAARPNTVDVKTSGGATVVGP